MLLRLGDKTSKIFGGNHNFFSTHWLPVKMQIDVRHTCPHNA